MVGTGVVQSDLDDIIWFIVSVIYIIVFIILFYMIGIYRHGRLSWSIGPATTHCDRTSSLIPHQTATFRSTPRLFVGYSWRGHISYLIIRSYDIGHLISSYVIWCVNEVLIILYMSQQLTILPCNERSQFRWNADPFDLTDGGSGFNLYDPGAWLLPYWMARYHGLIV